jgi:hypothetical protein
MPEAPTRNPSFSLVVPTEYDLGRNTYRIEGNEMYYASGILVRKFFFKGETTLIKSPMDAQTGERDDGHIVFQSNVKKATLDEILREMDRLNEQSRETISKLLGDKAGAKGRPWMQILQTPGNMINGNPDFDVAHMDGNGFYQASFQQGPETDQMVIEASSYIEAQELTRVKIHQILDNYRRYAKGQFADSPNILH